MFGRNWGQFSLRDLLAVVTIAGIGCVLLPPYILSSRQHSQQTKCADTLRQVGLHFHDFANTDPQQRFSTGASDFLYDGCPDTYGWLADIAAAKGTLRGPLFCPSSSVQGTATFNDLLAGSVLDAKGGLPLSRAAGGVWGSNSWRAIGCASSSEFAGTSPLTRERSSLVGRAFWSRGLNSNYVPSWFLTRTGVVAKYSGSSASRSGAVSNGEERKLVFAPGAHSASLLARGMGPIVGLDATLGALTLYLTESGQVPTSGLPLLGCGSDAEQLRHPLLATAWKDDPFAGKGGVADVPRGATLAPASNAGPVVWNPEALAIVPLPAGFSVAPQESFERDQYFIAGGHPASGPYVFQDTRGWYAWHTNRDDRQLNLLMADGSTRAITDENGDGYLNPGIPVPIGLKEAHYRETRYRNANVEFPPDVFGGLLIYRRTKGVLPTDPPRHRGK